MNPAIYPLIGFMARMVGGWIWQNLKPGIFAATVIALTGGVVFSASERIDALSLGLGVILASLVSFFGTVAGTRLRNYFERNPK